MDAKAALHHGEWGAWVAAHCTFAARTAQLYMQLARYAQANPQRVADLTLSEGIQVVRQAPEGPPYECRSPRLEWTLGFTCRIDYDRWVAFLRRHRSAGNPVPLLLRAAEHYDRTGDHEPLLVVTDEPAEAPRGGRAVEAEQRAIQALIANRGQRQLVVQADARLYEEVKGHLVLVQL